METRNISLTLEEAKEWYNSNIILRDIALKAFTKEELEYSFRNIKSFRDACYALGINHVSACVRADNIAEISKASAAMFKLNIIRKALNKDYKLNLTESPRIYYPSNPIITTDSDYYHNEFKLGMVEVIGSIVNEEKLYRVLSGDTFLIGSSGLANFGPVCGAGLAPANAGFLGCANEEIAKHFGKYFGMLITEAKYGDLPGFKIMDNKYQ